MKYNEMTMGIPPNKDGVQVLPIILQLESGKKTGDIFIPTAHDYQLPNRRLRISLGTRPVKIKTMEKSILIKKQASSFSIRILDNQKTKDY